jgi:hypothetical protein
MAKKVSLSLILVSLFVLACSNVKETDPIMPLSPTLGQSYFYLVEDKFREYDVHEIRFHGVDLSDTFSYQLREEVKAPFINDIGDTSHVIFRYVRASPLENWSLDSTWTARVNQDYAISVENNKSLVKMLYPTIVGETWDGNAFNTDDIDQYEIISFDEFFSLPNSLISFEKAMQIIQNIEDDSVTVRDNRREVFADSVGLVYKEYEVYKYCSLPECLGQKIIQSGRLYTETLTAHGSVGGS